MVLSVFMFWDKGYNHMPPILRYIHDHNRNMAKKYDFNIQLVSDSNIETFIDVPKRYWELLPNFKSDIARYMLLNKYGGIYLDTDVIIIRDLNKLYNNLVVSDKQCILDIEYGNKAGCCTMSMLPHSAVSEFCEYTCLETLKAYEGKHMIWHELGPDTIDSACRKLSNVMLINDESKVRKGCNFLFYKDNPGYNHEKWYFSSKEKAIEFSDRLLNNEECYYIITWHAYRHNNFQGDGVDFFLKDERSVYSHLIYKSLKR
jgi:hypothetical protein